MMFLYESFDLYFIISIYQDCQVILIAIYAALQNLFNTTTNRSVISRLVDLSTVLTYPLCIQTYIMPAN